MCKRNERDRDWKGKEIEIENGQRNNCYHIVIILKHITKTPCEVFIELNIQYFN